LKTSLTIKAVDAFVFRAPIARPVKTSFGTMFNRPAVFVRLEDQDGAVGWGEIWCNFPSCGAEHRAMLLAETFKPLILNKEFTNPQEIYQSISSKTEVLAIQSGEYGPIAQVSAGLDLAAWDLFSKKANRPLWRYLGGSRPQIKTYASGINPDQPEKLVEQLVDAGYNAFKIKVGFGDDIDYQNLKNIRKVIPQQLLMVDANQAWDVSVAAEKISKLEEFNLNWVEEPIRADCSLKDWHQIANAVRVNLAAGENIVGKRNFYEAITSGVFSVIQPDIAKWGGISSCLSIIQMLEENHIQYCPHYLGGGIGLLASAHLLAASGSSGMLEIDSNSNPLRSLVGIPLERVVNGWVTLTEEPGIGLEPNLDQLSQFLIH
jgi:D-galactarolactone cycloisomerase